MNWLLNRRVGFLVLALACAGMMAFALYLQYYKYLNPCPLCMFQRVFVIGVGAVALLAALHGPGQRRYQIYGLLAAVLALAGLAIAVRHTLLQYFPPASLPTCGAGLFQMLDTTPLGEVVVTVLKGSGECAVIDWTFLGFSLPGWSAVGFAGLLAGALALACVRRR
ncbi:disulfide bond formation protein B [Chitinimonas sp. BJYL2]|uniref:disulfide bond formation protein B n=1 Tax=Chitinimonas sp. BJYL2 TaxID=2976696 RepID=UPI0022B422BA|nr:disulfide bond formation protein B [Chitinimonas sp. BJYL2]